MLSESEFMEAYEEARAFSEKCSSDLRKTVFQCIFWEYCHYKFGLRLAEEKKKIQ